MPSLRDLAQLLLTTFKEDSSIPLGRALSELLMEGGRSSFEAAEEAEKMAPLVRDILLRVRPEDLPFDFGRSDPMLLVGKKRARPGENPQTLFARQARGCVEDLYLALCSCGDFDFEIVCAAALAMGGASLIFATCSGDDGGIDLYGRLPLRPPDSAVRPGLLQTTLLPTEILVLGQCKRYDRASRIGRPDLQPFLQAVRDCINKYEGNPRPPSHRVPDEFYRRGEVCLRVFMTTAKYAGTGVGEAEGNDVILVDGRQLSEFLVGRRVGIVQDPDSGSPTFAEDAFSGWLREARRTHQRQTSTGC